MSGRGVRRDGKGDEGKRMKDKGWVELKTQNMVTRALEEESGPIAWGE